MHDCWDVSAFRTPDPKFKSNGVLVSRSPIEPNSFTVAPASHGHVDELLDSCLLFPMNALTFFLASHPTSALSFFIASLTPSPSSPHPPAASRFASRSCGHCQPQIPFFLSLRRDTYIEVMWPLLASDPLPPKAEKRDPHRGHVAAARSDDRHVGVKCSYSPRPTTSPPRGVRCSLSPISTTSPPSG
jgi:hypothetical protein